MPKHICSAGVSKPARYIGFLKCFDLISFFPFVLSIPANFRVLTTNLPQTAIFFTLIYSPLSLRPDLGDTGQTPCSSCVLLCSLVFPYVFPVQISVIRVKPAAPLRTSFPRSGSSLVPSLDLQTQLCDSKYRKLCNTEPSIL